MSAIPPLSAAPPPAKTPRLRPVPAVSRAVAILRLLGRSPNPMGVKAIAESLGLVTSTCLHIVRVLVDEGLLKVDESTKRYSLGSGLLSLARNALQTNTFPSLAQPVLDRIAAQWNVTAIAAEVIDLDHMVVVALSKAHAPFRLHVDVGSRFPGLISATGRLMAAFSRTPWSRIEQRFGMLRWESPPSFADWRAEVELARVQRYSVDAGNYIDGVTLVAAPVFDAQGKLSHSLTAAGMSSHLDDERAQALALDVLREADALSRMSLPA
ncbi:IclR family transcriptional regulator [Bordetella petrii]|uniref:IclR family transcriptional regulator n=1 Tax=Bordetella petrii TaxID=94624 RepID=UPI001A971163|nr:IclR family transcriptional regulator [Bordetella petrii]MBO1111019.1 IclR family transcriptional regulator [Bordetella petrii]